MRKEESMTTGSKILVIGCGSIGRRHIRNFNSLGVEDFILCDTNEENLKAAAEGLSSTVLTKDFRKALEHGPDMAVICTPSSLHLEMARELVRAGVHVLIEKPLSDTLEGVTELEKLVEEKGVVAMMAMCYRHHPVFLEVKASLASGAVGKIYHVNYFGGHYLPDWHPKADYRVEYAAQKRLGGGVVLTSIHGLDNIRWLFGEVEETHAFVDRISGLEMDVEDIATAIFRLKSGVLVNWQTDFLQRANQHRMVVAGSKGTIRVDFLTGVIETYSAESGKWSSRTVSYEVNEMYVAEARQFLECVAEKLAPEAGVRDGHRTLKLALEVKGTRNLLEERSRICKTA